MNKTILWLLMAMMTACAIAYVITNEDSAFTSTMVFGAAALIVFNNNLKSAQ